MAAVDYFLKIDGIDGSSNDKTHKGEIEVESFSWGETQLGTIGSAGGGSGAGKVSMQDFHFTTQTSKASPVLFRKCATGEHIKEATLTARKSGSGQQEFLVIKMNDVLISSYNVGGSSDNDEVPTDQLSLNFAKIAVVFTNPDGTVVNGDFDQRENR